MPSQFADAVSRIQTLKNAVRSFLRKREKTLVNRKLPFKGFAPSTEAVKYIDILEDEELLQLNKMFDWNCFTVDSHGRRFGMAAWGSKRINPELIPDPRIVKFHERFDLSNMHVLEVGCFEGIHTLGLLKYAKHVAATDARIDHVIKTQVRCNMYGFSPSVFRWDVESIPADVELLATDFLHHVGVLYHLKNPVGHLLDMGRYVRRGVMIDTHFSRPEEATEKYSVDGNEYAYKRYLEYGKQESFSGMYDHSKWILLDDIIKCLKQTGFNRIEIVDKREERNGPRVLLFAERD